MKRNKPKDKLAAKLAQEIYMRCVPLEIVNPKFDTWEKLADQCLCAARSFNEYMDKGEVRKGKQT